MSLNVKLIRESFEAVKPHAAEFVDHFYDTLFKKYPQAKPLFANVDMNQQKLALINSLVHIVDQLENKNHLVQFLENMGARHLKYGTKEEHFQWVGDALVSTFEYFFDEQWTDELKGAWTEAYQVISDVMKQGMKTKAKEKKSEIEISLSDYAAKVAKELFEKALNEQIRSNLQSIAKEEVRKALKKAIEEEVKEILSDASGKQLAA